MAVKNPWADTTYNNESGALSRAMSRFRTQNTADVKSNTRDTQMSLTGIDRNQTSAQINNAEDFAARGNFRSGGFRKELNKVNQSFSDQRTRVNNASTDRANDLRQQLGAKEDSIATQQSNAKQSALARYAQKQQLASLGK